MFTRATRSLRGGALLFSLILLGMVQGCSPDAFLVSDEDRDRNFQRALAAERLRDYEGAAEYYERALERNPRASNVHLSYAALCEGHLQRYADAVHHYQRYLRLNPGDPKADDIRRRVTNCTERLATSVPLVIRSETIARDLEAIRKDNLSLRNQVTQYVAQAVGWSNEVRRLTNELAVARAAALASASGNAGRVTPADRGGAGTAPSTRGSGSTGGYTTSGSTGLTSRGFMGGTRIYRVIPGDTLAAIARRHGTTVSALRRANPTLNERRMTPGTLVRIAP